MRRILIFAGINHYTLHFSFLLSFFYALLYLLRVCVATHCYIYCECASLRTTIFIASVRCYALRNKNEFLNVYVNMVSQTDIETALKNHCGYFGDVIVPGFTIKIANKYRDLFNNNRSKFIYELFNQFNGIDMCKIVFCNGVINNLFMSVNAEIVVYADVVVTGKIQCTTASFIKISNSVDSFDANYYEFRHIVEDELKNFVFPNVKTFEILDYDNGNLDNQPDSEVIENSFPNMERYNCINVEIIHDNLLLRMYELSDNFDGEISMQIVIVNTEHELFDWLELEGIRLFTRNDFINHINYDALDEDSQLILEDVQDHERIVQQKTLADFHWQVLIKNANKLH